MKSHIYRYHELPTCLSTGIFADRRRQFVDRLQWDLHLTPSGGEEDEYDDEYSEYLVVHEGGRHMGSCRVRPITRSTMITDYFRDSFKKADYFLKLQKGRMYELTRFCRSPDVSVLESEEVLFHLTLLMDLFRDQRRLAGFVAIVFPSVARFMDMIGMRYVLLAKSTVKGQLVYMICITHATSVKTPERLSSLAKTGGSLEEMLAA